MIKIKVVQSHLVAIKVASFIDSQSYNHMAVKKNYYYYYYFFFLPTSTKPRAWKLSKNNGCDDFLLGVHCVEEGDRIPPLQSYGQALKQKNCFSGVSGITTINIIIFNFRAIRLLVGRQEGHLACKKLYAGGDDLTGALNVL